MIKLPFRSNLSTADLMEIGALMKELPVQAAQDLAEDLMTSKADKDLVDALRITVAAHKRTGLDGPALYAVVDQDVRGRYDVAYQRSIGNR